MRREAALGIAILIVILGLVVAAAVVPESVRRPTEPVTPGRVQITDVLIAPGQISGGTATLSVTTVMTHEGGHLGNVEVRVQAINTRTGMLAATQETGVASLEPHQEARVTLDVPVPREDGYRIETVVYNDGRRVDTATKTVQGVGTLQPQNAVSPVEFHGFDSELPPIQYTIAGVDGDRTELDVSSYLTNQGDNPVSGLRLELIARQADSNIVAARTTVQVGSVQPGETVTPGAILDVPSDYNYYLDAILWKDNVIVGTSRSVANLNPTERISVNTSVREVGLEVSDFEEPRRTPPARTPAESVSPGQPGFGLIVALVALTFFVIFRRSRS